jgi:tetratricopeptide (TPR) repeat protein
MQLKKLLYVWLVLILSCGVCFAGSLLSRETIDYFNKGVDSQEADKVNEAEAYYQKVLLMEPDNQMLRKYLFNNRGVLYAQQGDWETAERDFLRALRIDPAYRTAQLNLGLIYDKRKSRLESLEYWARFFEIEKQKPGDFLVEKEKLE